MMASRKPRGPRAPGSSSAADAPPFPSGVPVDIQARIRRRAEAFRASVVRTPAKRKREAQQIATAAHKLLRAIGEWYGRYSNPSDDADARDIVEARLGAWRSPQPVADLAAPPAEMSPEEYRSLPPRDPTELDQIRAGFERRSLDRVLLGMQMHMQAVVSLSPPNSTRVDRERAMVAFAARLFVKAGLPVKRTSGLFPDTCRVMHEIAGIVDIDGEPLDPDNRIRELIESGVLERWALVKGVRK